MKAQPLTIEVGETIEVTTELKAQFRGKLIELDAQNLVIETELSITQPIMIERVFRVGKCSYRPAPKTTRRRM